ncbi:MAG: hypothetical protein ACOYMN_02690 [Roseimicrobium sp.]
MHDQKHRVPCGVETDDLRSIHRITKDGIRAQTRFQFDGLRGPSDVKLCPRKVRLHIIPQRLHLQRAILNRCASHQHQTGRLRVSRREHLAEVIVGHGHLREAQYR